jgi:serine/threonine protein kinase
MKASSDYLLGDYVREPLREGGEPLDRMPEQDQGRPLNLTRFLRVAISLAKALDQVHRQGLIHKDIKPA